MQPDVVLMDIDMPGRDGIQAVTSIHREFPAVEVLMLTVFDDDDRVFRALCAGASGYLLKLTSPDQNSSTIKLYINRTSGTRSETFTATRIVVIPASDLRNGRKAAVDYSNYEAVKEFYNLPD